MENIHRINTVDFAFYTESLRNCPQRDEKACRKLSTDQPISGCDAAWRHSEAESRITRASVTSVTMSSSSNNSRIGLCESPSVHKKLIRLISNARDYYMCFGCYFSYSETLQRITVCSIHQLHHHHRRHHRKNICNAPISKTKNISGFQLCDSNNDPIPIPI